MTTTILRSELAEWKRQQAAKAEPALKAVESDDLVMRLLKLIVHARDQSMKTDLLEDAVREISSLRAQLASARKALGELSDPLLIKVAGHLTGTARALAIIHAMKEIARAALNPEPTK